MAAFGTVSSAIGLVAQTLTLYQHLSAVRAYEDVASEIAYCLEFEYFRFESWAEQSGYVVVVDSTGPTDKTDGENSIWPVSVDRVHFLVAQVSEVLETLYPLLAKYKIHPDVDEEGPKDKAALLVKRSATHLPEEVNNKPGLSNALAKIAITKLRLGKDTGRLRKVNFGWSLTNEFNDRDKIKELISQLKYWNDALRETLPPQSQPFHAMLSQVRIINHASSQGALDAIALSSKDVGGSLYDDVQYAAYMKSERLSVDDSATADEADAVRPVEDACLALNDSALQSSGVLVTTLTKVSREGASSVLRVIVDRAKIEKNLSLADTKLLERRTKELQHLLRRLQRPSVSLLPVCAGYVQKGPTDYLLLYELPKFADPIDAPRTLYDLFPVNKNSVPKPGRLQFLPLLDQRIALAQALTNGILQLHSVCWLHKALHSDNVLLFMTPTGLSLSQPLLSGFGLGRAADPGQQTIDLRGHRSQFDIYQHPDLRAESHKRYERRYDIYSLGLILFEIGMWQSLHYFLSDKKTPEDFRRRIVNFSISHLGHLMGKVYQEVVLLCIDQDELWKAAEADGTDPSNILEIFSWKVARKIGGVNNI